MIRITSKINGFRRGGLAHADRPTDYPDDFFSVETLAQFEAEPNLIVVQLLNPELDEQLSSDEQPGLEATGKKSPANPKPKRP